MRQQKSAGNRPDNLLNRFPTFLKNLSVSSISQSVVSLLRRHLYPILAIATLLLCLTPSPLLARSPSFLSSFPSVLSSLPSPLSLFNQGRLEYEAGEFEQAAETWQQAATEYARQGDRLNETRSRLNQAQALKSLGYYQAALKILKDLKQIVENDPDSVEKAQILRSLGDTYYAVGDLVQARAELTKSLEVSERINSTQDIRNARFHLGLVNRIEVNQLLLQRLKIDYEEGSRQNLENVLKHLNQARQSFQQATGVDSLTTIQANLNEISLLITALPEFNRIFVESLGDESLALADLADLPLAFLRDFLNDSTLVLRPNQVSDRTDGRIQKFTTLHWWKAEIVHLTEDLLSLLTQIPAQLDGLPPARARIDARLNYAQNLLKLRSVSLSTGEVDLRLRRLRDAIKLAQAEDLIKPTASVPHPVQPPRLLSPFLPEKTLQEFQTVTSTSLQVAASTLKQAVADAQSLKNKRAEAYALTALAELYGQQAKTGQASDPRLWVDIETLCQRSQQLAQQSNSPEIIYRTQRLLGKALREQGNLPGARAAYRVAARTLQSLRGDLVAVNQDVQYDFRNSVEPIYRETIEVLLPAPGETPNQSDLEEVRQVIESLQLAELDNFLRQACIQGKKIALDQVVDQDNPNTAVIYPIILPRQRLGVIAKIPGQKELRYQAFDHEAVEATLKALWNNLNTTGESPDLERLAKVYGWLIEPFRTELEQRKVDTLVFVPDGEFRNVPMATLFDARQQKYLIQEYAIAISPGLQLFDPKLLAQTRLNVLAAGKQNFSGSPSNDPSSPTVGRKFGSLTAVKAELQAIRDRVQAQILFESEFTRESLAAGITTNPVNVVHIATHGVFGYRKEDTYIVADDGEIYVDQLSKILRSRDLSGGTSIELLVLSACETAQGNDRLTLGIAGIAVQAGARSALGSLWLVNDQSTSVMMDKFYTELAKAQTTNITKAKALQIAQRDLLENSEYPSEYKLPYHWAPFILVGNWL